MKINPVAIQTYQQANRQNRASIVPTQGDEVSTAEKTVSIPMQDESQGSSLAVKPSEGSYAEYLSPEEREALELLFDRFRIKGRSAESIRSQDNADTGKSPVGRLIDLKA